MEEASKHLVKDELNKQLKEAIDAKKRLYEEYSSVIPSSVMDRAKALDMRIRELEEEIRNVI